MREFDTPNGPPNTQSGSGPVSTTGHKAPGPGLRSPLNTSRDNDSVLSRSGSRSGPGSGTFSTPSHAGTPSGSVGSVPSREKLRHSGGNRTSGGGDYSGGLGLGKRKSRSVGSTGGSTGGSSRDRDRGREGNPGTIVEENEEDEEDEGEGELERKEMTK